MTALNVGNQLGHGDAQHVGDPDQRRQRRILQAALQATPVVAVVSRGLRKIVLRASRPFAGLAYPGTKPSLRFLAHSAADRRIGAVLERWLGEPASRSGTFPPDGSGAEPVNEFQKHRGENRSIPGPPEFAQRRRHVDVAGGDEASVRQKRLQHGAETDDLVGAVPQDRNHRAWLDRPQRPRHACRNLDVPRIAGKRTHQSADGLALSLGHIAGQLAPSPEPRHGGPA